ncbi:MAG TPA: metal ABC transporter substrate-binding protein [Parvibaculum sp.]
MRTAAAALAFGLALVSTPALAKEVSVVASFSVLGDIVKEVGGDKIALTVLVGPDGDAHTFEPSPADAKTLANADLLVVNGLGLESWLPKLAAASGTNARFATASFGVLPRDMNEDGKDITDPHAWQSLSNGAIYVRNVEEALEKVDPADAPTFKANASKLLAELAGLDQWTRQQLAAVPADKRKVITTHDAFGYFGAAYGVTFLAPEGISTDSEPSAKGLAALTDQIKREHIKALFIENMTDPRLMQTISKETGAEMGGELYSDALSAPDGPAPTYPGMFRNNVPKLVAAMLKN